MKYSITDSDDWLDDAWMRASGMVSATVSVALATVVVTGAFVSQESVLSMPAFWVATLVSALGALEWWSLRVRRRMPWGGRVMPVAALLAAVLAMATRTPEAYVWVLACMFVVFMRFPMRTAQVLSMGAVLVCSGLASRHWQMDNLGIVRTLMSGGFLVVLLSNFFATSRVTSQKLQESGELLSSTLQSMVQGLQVIGPDGRIKLFNDKACQILDLPQELLARRPLLEEVTRLQHERGDFGDDFANIESGVRASFAKSWAGRASDVPHTYTRRAPDGRYIEVITRPMPSGDVVRTFSDVTAHEQMNAQLQVLLRDYEELRRREMQRSREHLIDALCMLSQYRDNETGRHIMRTQLFVRTLAEELARSGRYGDALDAQHIDRIVKAAPMHDLGKIGIPDHILLKPGGHTEDERLQMRTHAAIGESTLLIAARGQGAEQSVLMTAARIAGGHHENWDGSGYPRALAGEAIPLEARLMSLADVYDALTTTRPYKRAWSHVDACAEIHRLAGVKFDPTVAAAFGRRAEAFRDIAAALRDPDNPAPVAG